MATIVGTGNNDTIQPSFVSPGVTGGTPGIDNDYLQGGSGNDWLQGGVGDDTLDGGTGHDVFFVDSGNDIFIGGADTYDQIFFFNAGATTGAIADLSTGLVLNDGMGGTDSFSGVEVLTGWQFADSLVGSAGMDFLSGAGGNDTLQGGDGNDFLDGGIGSDSLIGGNGDDQVSFSYGFPDSVGVTVNLQTGIATSTVGTSTLSSIEKVMGTASADSIVGNGGSNTLSGGGGDDVLRGGAGNDSLIGGVGFDVASYAGDAAPISATVTYNGYAGHSATVSSAEGIDTLREIEAINGTSGGDFIQVLSVDGVASFQARGLGGNDTIVGMADRNFSIFADYRVAGVTSGVVVDLAAGIASNDGFGGQDSLVNIAVVRGTDLGDSIFGTAGNERFRGRGGNDWLDGRGGTGDQLDYTQSSAAVSVNLATNRAQDGEGGIDTVLGFEDVRATNFNDTIIGTADAEFFAPFGGNDSVVGGGGQDRVGYGFGQGNLSAPTQGVTVNLVTGIAQDGWGGTDTLSGIERVNGTNFADSILGGAESNRFRGDAGNDTLDGGLGGDYAEYTSATAGVTVNLTTGIAQDGLGGTDRLISIENVIGGNFADHLTGVAQRGRTTSLLRGGSGNDTLVGINGEYVLVDYADQTTGLSINLGTGTANDGRGGTDTLINIRGVNLFGDFADTVLGTAANEWFNPSGGADSVNAAGGFDIIAYGGSDSGGVSVNLATGRARDTSGAIDTILGFEGVATAFGADTIIGNGLGNLISPGAGADNANGGAGEDTISYSHSFAPNGVQYTVNEAGDRAPVLGITLDLVTQRATDFGGAIDTIIGFEHAIGSTASDVLNGSGIANYLAGAEGNDTLAGRAGADTLDGGDGNDRMLGGLDDDTYIVNSALDVVVEALNQGTDTVRTTLAAYTLGANVENLVATNAVAHSFIGNALNNAMTGGAGADTINGGAGSDTIDGGLGNDRMLGSIGDDTYIVGAALDVVVEALNQGIDTVRTTLAAYTLGANVENLVATNAVAHSFIGNGLNNAITGNAGADTINGGAGNDTIDGGAGVDRMLGGLGNDLIIVTPGDVVIEGLNQGSDTVQASAGAVVLAANVEALVLTGSATNGTGNGLANTIIGHDGVNVLNGGAGNDTIIGGGGADILLGGIGQDHLTGGSGSDRFRFSAITDSTVATPDVITDFTFAAPELDRIELNLIDANTALAGNQAFVYRGAAFTAAAGDLRVQTLATNLHLAAGDVNGDGTADFAILIQSSSAPSAGWFVL